MAERLLWREDQRRREQVDRAVARLRDGELAVLPTDSVYVLAADPANDAAVRRLEALTVGAQTPSPPTLVVAHGAGFASPQSTETLRRLVRRCWPGPLNLRVPARDGDAPPPGLSERLRERATQAGSVDFAAPDHPAILEIAGRMPASLLVGEATQNGAPLATEPASVREDWLREASVFIDDGPTRYRGLATIADASRDLVQVVREGVVSADRVHRLAGQVIAFVCSGNTCRSPLAEALFKKMLAQRLDCDPEELPCRGYTILSAGLSALEGEPASSGARRVAKEYGVSLEQHVAQSVSPAIAQFADHIWTMTADHRRVLVEAWPSAAGKVERLAGESDVSDPFGDSLERYRQSAAQIEAALRRRLEQIAPRRS